MPKEIERKFLTNHLIQGVLIGRRGSEIEQGYLPSGPGLTLRVRIRGGVGYLTLKGKKQGISCDEFEYEIPLDHARMLLDGYATSALKKTRFEIGHDGRRWEVDVFHGALAGLILAELELDSEDEAFTCPPWVTLDVSHRPEFSNARLAELAMILTRREQSRQKRLDPRSIPVTHLLMQEGPPEGDLPPDMRARLERVVLEVQEEANRKRGSGG